MHKYRDKLTPLASTNMWGYTALTSNAAAPIVSGVKLSSMTISAPALQASRASATLWHSTYNKKIHKYYGDTSNLIFGSLSRW
jgi:hypothetical protein